MRAPSDKKFSNWYVLLLLLAVVPVSPLLFQKGFLLQHDIFASDLLHNQFPYRAFAGKWISHGRFPMWMPDVFSGLPYLPQIEAGPFYLPNILLFGMLDPYAALNLSIVFTFLLSAFGAFFLAKEYGTDIISACLAGLVFALAGFNISHVKHMSMHEAAAVLPWMMLCLEKALRSSGRVWLVCLALATAFQITAGHPQIVYYSLLLLSARIALFLGQEIFKKGRAVGARVIRPFVSKAVGVALAVVLGFGLCGIQLVTTFKFNQSSIRGSALDWKFASAFPYFMPDMLTFLYPPANGMVERMTYRGTIEWENYGYVGLLALALIVVSALYVRGKTVWFYLGAMVGSMMLVVGPATPLYRLLWSFLPGMRYFRFPTRFLLIVALSAAMLSALGVACLVKRLGKTRRRSAAEVVAVGLVLLSFVDLFYWQRMRMPIDDLAAWKKEIPAQTVIRKRGGEGRTYCLFGPEFWQLAHRNSKGFQGGFESYRLAGELPFGNLSVVYGLTSADGYTNMVDGRTASFWMWYNTVMLSKVLQPKRYDEKSQRLTEEFASLLNLANVRYLVAPVPVRNENFSVLDDGPVKVYENTTALPRAYLAYNWKRVDTIEEAARWLFAREHNAIPAIEGDRSSGRSDSSGAVAEVAVQANGPDRLDIDVHPLAEGYLILTDSFDPGWKAEIDGELRQILPANGYQRAVKVDPGSRKIVFSYRPPGFRAGTAISLVSLLALSACLAVPPLISRRNRSATPSAPAPE
jgi:hypothetical protein